MVIVPPNPCGCPCYQGLCPTLSLWLSHLTKVTPSPCQCGYRTLSRSPHLINMAIPSYQGHPHLIHVAISSYQGHSSTLSRSRPLSHLFQASSWSRMIRPYHALPQATMKMGQSLNFHMSPSKLTCGNSFEHL